MNYNQINQFAYALFLTNGYGFRLRRTPDPQDKKKLRLEYARKLFARLNLTVRVEHTERLPRSGQYLLAANHRSIIDPLVVDIALENTDIFGAWLAKKELYRSPFFGMAIRHGGCVRVDRENRRGSYFFSDIKKNLNEGNSIFVFPEGTRNKTSDLLLPFKNGARFIALKNSLPILPVYIETHTGDVLRKALENSTISREVTIMIGKTIDFKSKNDIEILYRKMFGLDKRVESGAPS